jgi:hypothetical protein
VSESSWGFKSPLAHLLHDLFRQPRRHRRRLAIPVILSLVVGFGLLLAVTAGDDATPLYSEELRKASVELSLKAEVYRNTLLVMGTTDRASLDETTSAVLATMAEANALLDQVPEDPAYSGPVALLKLSLEQWIAGIEGLRTEILAVADGVDAPLAEVRLLNSLIDAKAGDRLFRAFVEAMGRAEVTPPVSPFPNVEFVPVQVDMGALSGAFFVAASNPASPLKLRAELALTQVLTVPELIINTDGGLVVTDTNVLTVKTVVSNRGNAVTEPIVLLLTLLEGGSVIAERRVTVEPVAPGAQTTVTFEDLAVVPGTDYGLVVTLPIAEAEEVTEDNQRLFDFRVNEPVSTTTTTA